MDAHFVKHLEHGVELRQAAVEDNQIGLRTEALVGHAFCAVSALHDLLHRQEVIGLIKRRLNFKAPILVFVGPSAREHHHGSNRIRAVNGRNIEALNAHGGNIHCKRAFKLQQGIIDAFILVVRTHLVAHERVLRILACHVEQVSLFATLGHSKTNLCAMGGVKLVRKPCLHRRCIFQFALNDDLVRNRRGGVVIAKQKGMEQIFVGHIAATIEHELVAVHNATFPHHEHMNARDGLLAGNAHNVSVQVARRNRVLFVGKRIDCIDARLDTARTLEIKFSGRIAHFARELVDKFTTIAREKTLNPLDVVPVFLGGNTAAARTRPKAYVRIEARPRSRLRQKSLERPRVELALQAAPFVAFRRTNRHDFARDIDQVARRAAIGVRAKISRTLHVLFTRVFNSGENIAFRNRDERIAFIVFEVGVEER